MLLLSGIARAQADTARRRPIPLPRAATPASMPDSGRASDIEVIEIVHLQAEPGPMDPAVRRRMLDTLAVQRRFWNERRPRQYGIRVFELSHCLEVRAGSHVLGELLRDLLVVRDTTIVRRELAPTPAAYAQRCLRGWRVDDLFADVARTLADTSAWIGDVEYDAAYGFPRAYRFDRGPVRFGHGRKDMRLLVESFAPTP